MKCENIENYGPEKFHMITGLKTSNTQITTATVFESRQRQEIKHVTN